MKSKGTLNNNKIEKHQLVLFVNLANYQVNQEGGADITTMHCTEALYILHRSTDTVFTILTTLTSSPFLPLTQKINILDVFLMTVFSAQVQPLHHNHPLQSPFFPLLFENVHTCF